MMLTNRFNFLWKYILSLIKIKLNLLKIRRDLKYPNNLEESFIY